MDKVVNLVHFHSRPGGIEVLFPLIIDKLKEYKIKAYVIRKPLEGDENIYTKLNIPVKYGSNKNFKAFFKAYNYFKKNKNDIFHGYNIGPIFLIILHFAGVKNIVYSIHGTIYWKSRYKKFLLKNLWNIALKKNVTFTSNSEFSKRVFLEKIDSSVNIKVIYNPIDWEKFSLKNKIQANYLKIIYSGRLSGGKNLSKWIQLATRINETIPETIFEIYGEGPLKEMLNKQIKSLGAERYIKLKGFRSDIFVAYQESSLLLFLSEYESFGNVVVESVLCGTPVIASAIPSMKEIFENFPDFLVELDENLEKNILAKIRNIENLKNQLPKVREEFKERFSIDSYLKKINTIYNNF